MRRYSHFRFRTATLPTFYKKKRKSLMVYRKCFSYVLGEKKGVRRDSFFLKVFAYQSTTGSDFAS